MSEDFEIEIPPTFEHLAMVRSVLSSALEAEPSPQRRTAARFAARAERSDHKRDRSAQSCWHPGRGWYPHHGCGQEGHRSGERPGRWF